MGGTSLGSCWGAIVLAVLIYRVLLPQCYCGNSIVYFVFNIVNYLTMLKESGV